MGITTAWDAEGNIVYTFEGEWTWDNLNEAEKIARQIMATVDHPVYFIFDMRAGPLLPQETLAYARYAPPDLGKNDGGKVVVVNTSRYMRAIFEIVTVFRPAFRERFALVPDLEAAYSHLKAIKQARLEDNG
jgi:hypothetical protein